MLIEPKTDRANRLAWALNAAILLVVLAWLPFTAIRIAWLSLAVPVAAGIALGALGAYYRRRRGEARIADAFDICGQFTVFTAAGVVLSYLAVTPGLPMQDELLHRIDQALGLDWLGWLGWLARHDWLAPVLSAAYSSLMVQLLLLLMLLPLLGRGEAGRVMALAMIVSGVISILLSGLLPALSTFAHYKIDLAAYPNLNPAVAFVHLPDLTAAHSGRPLLLDLGKAYGIITFPSYHAALGLLALIGAWSHRWLRWPFAIVNILMIVATPIDGGHYFTDVLGGLAIAALSYWLVRQAVGSRTTPVPAKDSQIAVPGAGISVTS